MSKQNWNKMAGWYSGMVGKSGHDFHQKYAIPTVIELLNVQPQEKILDVGCGPGAISSHIKTKGGQYFGIDASPNLIKTAIKQHKNEGRFYVGDASKLTAIPEIKDITFDKALFMLSIQDMDPLEKIISETVQKLKPKAELVIFMLHPAFRIPRQSGWGEDKKRKLIYRRMDRYLSENTIPLNTNVKHGGKKVTSYFYHRPLQKYFEVFEKSGLDLESFQEIAEEKKGYDEFPTFLCLKLTNKPTGN